MKQAKDCALDLSGISCVNTMLFEVSILLCTGYRVPPEGGRLYRLVRTERQGAAGHTFDLPSGMGIEVDSVIMAVMGDVFLVSNFEICLCQQNKISRRHFVFLFFPVIILSVIVTD